MFGRLEIKTSPLKASRDIFVADPPDKDLSHPKISGWSSSKTPTFDRKTNSSAMLFSNKGFYNIDPSVINYYLRFCSLQMLS
jgi:hypothetical protein